MPKTEGIIPRKILPVFVIVQEFEDERDAIYRSIVNGILKKYQLINENNSDAEVCIYLLKFNSEGVFATDSLLNIDTSFDYYAFMKAVEIEDTFENVLMLLSEVMSTKNCFSAEIGYYRPIVFFLVDEFEIDEVFVKKINDENRWFKGSTKIALPFSDCFDEYIHLLGTREAVFAVSKDMDEKKIKELVNVICDIRIDSITHSIQASFYKTGYICAAISRGAIDEPDEYNESLYDFYHKQQLFKEFVFVDPIDETEVADDEPIALDEDLATPEEMEIDEETAETSDDEKNADSNASDDYTSESWDD